MPDERILKQALRRSTECPSLDLLSGQLTGPAGTAERHAAEAHLAQCLYCKTEIDLLQKFESGAVVPSEESHVRWIASRLAAKPLMPAPAKPVWWTVLLSPRALTGLASIAAIAVIAVAISHRSASDFRSRPVPEFGQEVLRSQTIQVLDSPGAFRWEPVPGAAQYDLTVRTVDGSVIFHKMFTTEALSYPPEVDTTSKTGKLLLWEVVAKDSAGRDIARSGVQRMHPKALLPQQGR